MSEWEFFEPDFKNPHTIIKFDDGNDNYKNISNTWYICGTWKGKVRLINEDKKTYINCISAWKIIKNIDTNMGDYTFN